MIKRPILAGLAAMVCLAFFSPLMGSMTPSSAPCTETCEHEYDGGGIYVRTICTAGTIYRNCVPNTEGKCIGTICMPTSPEAQAPLAVLDELGEVAGLVSACDPDGPVFALQ